MKIREGYYSEQIRNSAFSEIYSKLNEKQKNVFEIIFHNQPIYSEKIANLLGVYPHEISPRVLELRKLGIVEFAKEGKSDISNKKVSLWKIKTSQGELFEKY